MLTRKLKLISAAMAVAALLATVAVAHTVRSHETMGAAPAAQATGNAVSPAAGATEPFQSRGTFACGLPSAADCQKAQSWFPE
jgi:hypothetical protein